MVDTVERAINKLKHARAVATRYDKRGYIYLGTVTAAALVIWLLPPTPYRHRRPTTSQPRHQPVRTVHLGPLV